MKIEPDGMTLRDFKGRPWNLGLDFLRNFCGSIYAREVLGLLKFEPGGMSLLDC